MGTIDPTPDPSPEQQPPDDSPLAHIIDETEAVGDCRTWIHGEFVKGRDADSILEELIGNGWPTDDAEGLVEEGRRATRHLRGVMTRDGVLQSANKRYRKTFRISFRIALVGTVAIIAVIYGCYPRAHNGKSPTTQKSNASRDE